jgi:hypothetical protein
VIREEKDWHNMEQRNNLTIEIWSDVLKQVGTRIEDFKRVQDAQRCHVEFHEVPVRSFSVRAWRPSERADATSVTASIAIDGTKITYVVSKLSRPLGISKDEERTIHIVLDGAKNIRFREDSGDALIDIQAVTGLLLAPIFEVCPDKIAIG